jgi:hypothetical protein
MWLIKVLHLNRKGRRRKGSDTEARKIVKVVGVQGAKKSRKASVSDTSSRITSNRIVLFLRRRTILAYLFLWL